MKIGSLGRKKQLDEEVLQCFLPQVLEDEAAKPHITTK
jgi:hypothetical protein